MSDPVAHDPSPGPLPSPEHDGERRLRFAVVVPVKPVARAKSRLASLGDAARRELVAAFAADTVAAALQCPAVGLVLVVTDEVPLARAFDDLGVLTVPDSGELNETLAQGAAEALRRAPHLRPVALCADLPALRTEDLDAALAAAPDDVPSFVADAAGIGTTLYTAPDLARFVPRFGPASRAAHLAAGAVELPAGTAGSLRHDVDTPEDLEAARALGLGPRTAWALTVLGLDRDPLV